VWKPKPEQMKQLLAQPATFLLLLAMIVWWINWLVDQQILLTCGFLWFELDTWYEPTQVPVKCRISALVALA